MNDTFMMIPKWLLSTQGLSLTAKVLAAVLIDHRNPKTGQCNPRLQMLADEMGVSQRTVCRGLDELKATGLLRVTSHRLASQYDLAPPFKPCQNGKARPRQELPNWQDKPCQNGKAGGPVSLFSELDQLELDYAAAAAVGGRMREAAAAASQTCNANGNGHGRGSPEAEALAGELMAGHPEKGQPLRAIPVVDAILRASPDATAAAATIRAHHAAFVAEWTRKRSLRADAFVPQLWRWFADGDYLNLPSKPPEIERRKSRLEEAFDRA